ncbi:MAG: arylesterase [Hyphomicrobiaceae bacterium]
MTIARQKLVLSSTITNAAPFPYTMRFPVDLGILATMFNIIFLCAALIGSATAQAEEASAPPIKIIAFGDSLTAGYQLPASAAFPAQLEKALRAKGHNVVVINAGVSGDTTAAGLARLDWAVPNDADAVIVELGANDFLRGIKPKILRTNLDKILERIAAKKKPILIAGMISPQNWGGDYETAATSIYPDLAKKHDALLYPFFMEGIARNPKLNLEDGLHPNAKGVAIIVERILPLVEKLVDRVGKNP